MKIRSGCEGGGKGPLVQNDLSATSATHQDQTVFAQQKKVRCFDYEMGAKVGSISYGKISPTIKTRQKPAVVIERSNEGADDGQ